MKTVTILCDECDCDLTTTGNSVDYRISLRSEAMPSAGDVVTDMMIYPQISPSRHFCSVKCLKEWVAKNL